MQKKRIHTVFRFWIAFVWIANGLFCKVLNLVPRHEQIVARILGNEFSRPLTVIIGVFEIGMAVWFLSGIKSRLNTFTQIGIVTTMNSLEFIRVPEMLLWGKLNSLFAFLFIITVYYNHFHLIKKAV
tara:strand:- start:10024 stop:10404 length:381 start_codon:yes stop_codon:yes gene_type:complete